MLQIVQCSPNISEGTRQNVVDAIAEAVAAGGARVLEVQSDPEQNRSVIVFAGDVGAVERSAFAAAEKSAELIDMRQHRGQHPRIGAVDVVPIVPVTGVSVADCAALARRLGERIGQELGLPVYLYAEAATRPERADLSAIRAGEYEGLAKTIADDPTRAPDYGPAAIGPAGATAIGVRYPWVAYRVGLGTSDTAVAGAIAVAISGSSGGLAGVDAGVASADADGRCTLELHVARPDLTPLARVLDNLRAESRRHGVGVGRCEIRGLVTLGTLLRSVSWSLQLDDLPADQVLEQRLWSALPGAEGDQFAPSTFVSAVADESPTPGGGAVAALAGALAAALDVMVAGHTIGPERYSAVQGEMRHMRGEAAQYQRRLLDAVEAERAVYDAASAAHQMAGGTPEEAAARRDAMGAAAKRAIEVPLGVMRDAVSVLRLCRIAAEMGNPAALADAGVAAIMARAAVSAAAINAESAIHGLRDLEEGDRFRHASQSLLREAEPLAAEIDRLVRTRIVG